MPDRYALAEIAERIAAAENRLHQLRFRLGRLEEEGSDARQEKEVLQILSSNLGELYGRQTEMRRTSWIRL